MKMNNNKKQHFNDEINLDHISELHHDIIELSQKFLYEDMDCIDEKDKGKVGRFVVKAEDIMLFWKRWDIPLADEFKLACARLDCFAYGHDDIGDPDDVVTVVTMAEAHFFKHGKVIREYDQWYARKFNAELIDNEPRNESNTQ